MTLIETERAVLLHKELGAGISMSGGSAANTMTGVASFGAKACYIGKVADDELGAEFGHDMRAVSVDFPNKPGDDGVPTGRCLIVVTPDAQRTMNTYLGISSLLGPDDIDPALIAKGKVLYMEGYLWDKPLAKAAYRKAAKASHAAGRLVSLTLSDSFCVDRHRADFRSLVTDDVDILFGNLDELLSLYETSDFDDAVSQVRADCQMAAITLGKEGSVIITEDSVLRIPVEPVAGHRHHRCRRPVCGRVPRRIHEWVAVGGVWAARFAGSSGGYWPRGGSAGGVATRVGWPGLIWPPRSSGRSSGWMPTPIPPTAWNSPNS